MYFKYKKNGIMLMQTTKGLFSKLTNYIVKKNKYLVSISLVSIVQMINYLLMTKILDKQGTQIYSLFVCLFVCFLSVCLSIFYLQNLGTAHLTLKLAFLYLFLSLYIYI